MSKKPIGYGGLEYVSIELQGETISAVELMSIEEKIAIEVIKNKPLRGRELRFLRKQMGLSYAKLSVKMSGHFDASTIAKWEKKKDERLSAAVEIYLRLFFAEHLELKLEASTLKLIPQNNAKQLRYAA